MTKRVLNSYSFAVVNLVLLVFTLWTASTLTGQQPSESMVIGDEKFALGMSRDDATKKMDKCCFLSGGNDPRSPKIKTFFIFNKDKTDILGTMWFRDESLERIEREGEYSQNPETFRFALSLYRLLSERTHSSAATIALVTNASEMSNASSKEITFAFRDGRSIQIEITQPDDPQKGANQIGLKEILEKR